MLSEVTAVKENYTTPKAKLIGFAPEESTAAFEFDDLLQQGAGKQDGATVSSYDVEIEIRENY